MGYKFTKEELVKIKEKIDVSYILEQTYENGNNFDLGSKLRTHINKCINSVTNNVESKNEKCYILHRIEDGLILVTTDKKYAEDLYASGEYIMKNSEIIR